MLVLGHVSVCSLTHWALVPCCRAVLLQGYQGRIAIVREVYSGADKFYWRVLQAVCVDKEPLVEVHPKVHLLSVVLVKHPYIFIQVALIVDAVKTLAWPVMTESILLNLFLVTIHIILFAYTLVCHRKVRRDIDIVLQVNLVFKAAKALQACFSLHLITKWVKLINFS